MLYEESLETSLTWAEKGFCWSGRAAAAGVGKSEGAGGDAGGGQPPCVASPRWGWGEEQLPLTKGKGGGQGPVF